MLSSQSTRLLSEIDFVQSHARYTLNASVDEIDRLKKEIQANAAKVNTIEAKLASLREKISKARIVNGGDSKVIKSQRQIDDNSLENTSSPTVVPDKVFRKSKTIFNNLHTLCSKVMVMSKTCGRLKQQTYGSTMEHLSQITRKYKLIEQELDTKLKDRESKIVQLEEEGDVQKERLSSLRKALLQTRSLNKCLFHATKDEVDKLRKRKENAEAAVKGPEWRKNNAANRVVISKSNVYLLSRDLKARKEKIRNTKAHGSVLVMKLLDDMKEVDLHKYEHRKRAMMKCRQYVVNSCGNISLHGVDSDDETAIEIVLMTKQMKERETEVDRLIEQSSSRQLCKQSMVRCLQSSTIIVEQSMDNLQQTEEILQVLQHDGEEILWRSGVYQHHSQKDYGNVSLMKYLHLLFKKQDIGVSMRKLLPRLENRVRKQFYLEEVSAEHMLTIHVLSIEVKRYRNGTKNKMRGILRKMQEIQNNVQTLTKIAGGKTKQLRKLNMLIEKCKAREDFMIERLKQVEDAIPGHEVRGFEPWSSHSCIGYMRMTGA